MSHSHVPRPSSTFELHDPDGTPVQIRYLEDTKQISVLDVIRTVSGKGAQYATNAMHRMRIDLKSQFTYHKFLSARNPTPMATVQIIAAIMSQLPKNNHEHGKTIIHKLCKHLKLSPQTFQPKSTTGFLYIASTKTMEEQTMYKIGKTNNIKRRMAELGTGHACLFYTRFVYPCQNARSLEAFIHSKLQDCRVTTNREFFQMNLNDLTFQVIELIEEFNRIHEPENIQPFLKFSTR